MFILRGTDDLLTEVERFRTRLALAHDALMKAVHLDSREKRDEWSATGLDGVRESLATLTQRAHATTNALEQAFKKYAAAAETLVSDLGNADPNKAKASQGALTDALEKTHSAAKAVSAAARQGQNLTGVGKWLGAVLTSLLLAYITSEYSARQREVDRKAEQERHDQQAAKDTAEKIKEAAARMELQDQGDCDDGDWRESGSVKRQPNTSCRVWTGTAWRSAPLYEIEVTRTVDTIMPLRARAHWIDTSKRYGKEVHGMADPSPTLRGWLCGVTKGAPFRVVVWTSGPGAAPSIKTTAIPSDQERRPCKTAG